MTLRPPLGPLVTALAVIVAITGVACGCELLAGRPPRIRKPPHPAVRGRRGVALASVLSNRSLALIAGGAAATVTAFASLLVPIAASIIDTFGTSALDAEIARRLLPLLGVIVTITLVISLVGFAAIGVLERARVADRRAVLDQLGGWSGRAIRSLTLGEWAMTVVPGSFIGGAASLWLADRTGLPFTLSLGSALSCTLITAIAWLSMLLIEPSGGRHRRQSRRLA